MSEKCQVQECRDNVTRLNFFMKIVGGTIMILSTIFFSITIYALAADKQDKEKVYQIEQKQAVVMDNLKQAMGKQMVIQKNQQAIMSEIGVIQEKIGNESRRSINVDKVILDKLNKLIDK